MGFNFPDAPTIGQVFTGYVWNGESWQVQGGPRSGLSSVKKNYIINGAMTVSQENGTANGTINAYYAVDLFSLQFASSTGGMNVQQTATATPAGSPMRYRFAAAPANTSPAAGDYVLIRHVTEGLRMADLRFGSAAAKTFTLQFGVKAPAGTYCVCFRNGASNRIYVAEYVISAGENLVDTQKSITLTGDVTGTWASDNTGCMSIDWVVMAGSSARGATVGAWSTTNLPATNNQINAASTSAGFELFDVSLTEGTVAPPFVVPDYASELAACSRYFQLSSGSANFNASSIGQSLGNSLVFVPPMRSSPTTVLAAIGPTTNLSGGAPSIVGANTLGARYEILSAAAGQCYALMAIIKCNARL